MGDYCIRCGKKNDTDGNVCSSCIKTSSVPVSGILKVDKDATFMTVSKHVFGSLFRNLHLWFVLVLFSMMINLFPLIGQLINFFLFSYFKKGFGLTSLKKSFLNIKTDFTDLFLASDTVAFYIPLALVKAVLFLIFFIVPKIIMIPLFALSGAANAGTNMLLVFYFGFVIVGTITLCIKLFVDMIINFSAYYIFDQRIDAFSAISKSKDLIFSRMWDISVYFLKVSLVMIPVYIIVFSPFLIIAPKIISFVGDLRTGNTDFHSVDNLFSNIFGNFFNDLSHSTFFIWFLGAIVFFMIMSSIGKIISDYYWAAGYLKYSEENK